ncbi:major facilitator superfamily domain-containing protein [Trichophaea hybrida]|nr:major facilitator superfamily domain-containing protein [Trichophaea hybrida]
MYEEEKVYEGASEPHESHESVRQNSFPSDLNLREVQIDYRYLDWDTPFREVYTNPDELPHKITTIIDPFQWPKAHKNWTLLLCCASTSVAAYTPGAYTSGLRQMQQEWGVGRVPLLVGVTTYSVGFSIAPMFLAPLSEVRSGFDNYFCHLSSALCHSFPGMLVVRFICGVGGSTFSSICGGVISDLHHAESRGFPMACFSTVAMFGTGAGPLVTIFMKETRGNVLLIRRAKALNNYLEAQGSGAEEKAVTVAGRILWKVRAEEERASLSQMVKVSLTRPFYLLFTEPVVFFFSLWAAFGWGVLYLFLQGVPLVFETSYNFTISQVGSVFTSMCVGSLLALGLNAMVERGTKVYLPRATGPDTRLYSACSLGSLLPIGMFWFGWTSFPSQHWILPTIAVGVTTIGIFTIYLAVFNYFADTYHHYASSALAAQSFSRNMFGAFFPLITDAMYHRMTFQGASSFLGGVGLALSIVPWVLVIYGNKIRERSKFAKEMMV